MSNLNMQPLSRPIMTIPDTFTNSKNVNSLPYLTDMLSYKRPADSDTEKLFIRKYIEPINNIQSDNFGNYYINILNKDKTNSDTAFTAHTDTVHTSEGFVPIYMIDDPISVYLCNDGTDVLGADDTTGIWLMLNMIEAKIPGLYIFFRAEEVGGLGSDHMSQYGEAIYKDINKMISFDRKGSTNIITHQCGSRCCSEEFSADLAAQLNQQEGFEYKSDSTGTFTDSANFVDEISECTNISVAYEHQHTLNEIQFVDHVIKLRDQLLKIDWSKIGHYRDPSIELVESYRSFSLTNSYATSIPINRNEAMNLVYHHPEIAAALLLEYDVTIDDVEVTAIEYGESLTFDFEY